MLARGPERVRACPPGRTCVGAFGATGGYMQSMHSESFALPDADVPAIAPAPLTASDGAEPPRLRLLDLADLLALEIVPRGMLLDPVIPERGLAMLYAARGIGKTHV